MKLCLATDFLFGYHTISAGAEMAIYNVAKILNKKHDISVICKKPLKPFKEEFKCYSVSTTEDFLGRKLGLYFLRFKSLWAPYDFAAFFSAYRLLKKIKPDVLMLMNFRELSFSIIHAARLLKIPMVYSAYDWWSLCPLTTLIKGRNVCDKFHGKACSDCFKDSRFGRVKSFLTRFRKGIFDSAFLSKMDALIVLAQQWKDIMVDYGLKKNRIHVVPLPLHKKIPYKESKPIKDSILFVGWVQWRKGLKQLIQAMPLVLKKNPKAKLYAIGPVSEPNYLNWINRFIAKNKLTKNVELLGKQPHEVVTEWLRKANVSVVPEQWPIAWPIALTEAMAYARPVVASDIGGIPDLLKQGSGFLVKPTSPKEFAEKINWCLSNPAKALKMGLQARKEILRITDPDRIVSRITAICDKVRKR